MTAGLLLPLARRRPTPGLLYVAGVAVFSVLVLVLVLAAVHAVDPIAVALVGVPLGPIGVVAAVIALPVLGTPPSTAVALLVLVVALAIAVVNVLLGALISMLTTRTPFLRR